MRFDPDKTAPTWLFKGGKTKQFLTQEEVDQAWKDGWNGDPNNAIEESEDKPFRNVRDTIADINDMTTIDDLVKLIEIESEFEAPRKTIIDAATKRINVLQREE